MSLHLPTLVTAHGWMLLAFTVMMGAMWRIIGKPSLRYWFYSDVSALIGLCVLYSILVQPHPLTILIFSVSTSLTMYCRVLSMCTDHFARRFKSLGLGLIFASFVMNLMTTPDHQSIRTFFNSSTVAVLGGCFVFVLLKSDRGHNRFGKYLIIASALAYTSVACVRAVYALLSDQSVLFHQTIVNTIASSTVIMLGVLAHIGFIIIVFDELNLAESQAAQAAIREAESRRHAEERERESLLVAEEQRGLVEILTHEVRQPLNNASAALQSIGSELDDHKGAAQSEALSRAQTVIDKVAIALSNALVAATILERRQQFNPVRCEPMLLVDMVVLDFNMSERKRIDVEALNAPLYVTADPVLLRIALRNLLDNALRYSAPGTKVHVRVAENEAEMGVEFSVSNAETGAEWMEGIDIFARRVRGHGTTATGSGIGLHITSEIAKLHQGWVRTAHDRGQRVFTMFLSD